MSRGDESDQVEIERSPEVEDQVAPAPTEGQGPAGSSAEGLVEFAPPPSGDVLELLPPAERPPEARVEYPELAPEEEVAIAGEDGAVHLERSLPPELRVLFGSLIPLAVLWSAVVSGMAGRVTIRGLDGWVFGDLSVYGTAVAIALAPWLGLGVLWVRARRSHGSCVLDGSLALLEAPLAWGRLRRGVITRADVVSWDEDALGFHLRYHHDSLARRLLVPSFVPGWSPRRKAAARAWLEGSGEIQPLRHLAQRPSPWPILGATLGGALAVVALRVVFELRYEVGAPGAGRYPAIEDLTHALTVCSALAVALVVAPLWQRRRVAVCERGLLVGEQVFAPAALRRVALADGRLAFEDARGRRRVLEVPTTPAVAEALRGLLPRGVTLDGALPGWARARVRRPLALVAGTVALWLALGNPPVYATRGYVDRYGQELHLVYRLSDQRPRLVALVQGDRARDAPIGLRVLGSGLQGSSTAPWSGGWVEARLDLDAGRVTFPGGASQPVAAGTTLLAWRPEPGSQPATEDLTCVDAALPDDLVARLRALEGGRQRPGGLLYVLTSGDWGRSAATVKVINACTVADLLAEAADWEGTPLEAVAKGDAGTRTHVVEDERHLLVWRAHGAELKFLVLGPAELAGRVQVDAHGRAVLDGRALPTCALVRVPSFGTSLQVYEGAPPRPDALAALATDMRRGRPIVEATRSLFPDYWAEATR